LVHGANIKTIVILHYGCFRAQLTRDTTDLGAASRLLTLGILSRKLTGVSVCHLS